MTLSTPDDRRYSEGDLWARLDDGKVHIGISDFAQSQLGEIVFVDVPEPGDQITSGESMGEVESTKTVSDLVAPVSGRIVEGNAQLLDNPDLLNSSPYEQGWIAMVEPDDPDPLASLMTAEAYADGRS